MHLGNGSLYSILFNRLESCFGIISRAATSLFDIGSRTKRLTFGCICFSCHSRQFLFDQTELVEEFAKGPTLSRICGCKIQSSARTGRRSGSQLQTPDIEDVERNL